MSEEAQRQEQYKRSHRSVAAQLTFMDLFAGIGGFHLAMHQNGGRCLFACEWDKFARQTYQENFASIAPDMFAQGLFAGDINAVDIDTIPSVDVVCAGFPCQPFSLAGARKGFEDARGTLFFRIAEIVREQCERGEAPKVLFLENVKGLLYHDHGRTLATICSVLDALGYRVTFRVLNAKHFGVPQNRERIFIVAWRKENPIAVFRFPLGLTETKIPIFEEVRLKSEVAQTHVGDILLPHVDERYTLSERLLEGHIRRKAMHEQRGNGFGFSLFDEESPYTNTLSARYYKDGSEILIAQKDKRPRRLHPIEAGRLQGFPIGDQYRIVVSDTQAYKQFGNSIAVPMVSAVVAQIVKQLL